LNTQSLVNYGFRVRYPANSIIFVQRDVATKLYYLEKGLVKLSFLSDQGDEKIVAFIMPGLIFGESAILLKTRYGITATAKEECIVIAYDRLQAAALIRHTENFAALVSTSMARELSFLGHQIIGTSFYDTTGRVGHALINLSHQLEQGNDATLALTHAELAKFVGASRISITNVLSYLENKKLVVKGRTAIRIPDRSALKNWLERQSYI